MAIKSSALSQPASTEPHGTCLVVNNPVSGTRSEEQAQEELHTIHELLGKRFSVVEVFETAPESDAAAWVEQQLSSRPEVEVVVACGGDGTVSEVASAVQRKAEKDDRAPDFGLIPRGTGNAIALALGVPTQLPDACKMITDGKSRRLDLARVTDLSSSDSQPLSVPLMLLAGIGLEAETVKKADRDLKNRLGPLAYLFSGIQSFARQGDPFKAQLTLEGISVPMGYKATLQASDAHLPAVEARAITIANLAPPTSILAQGIGEVTPDDGLVELVVFNPPSVETGLSAMWAMEIAGLFRRRLASKKVWGLRAKTLKIQCDPPQPIVVDGEIMNVGEKGIEVSLGQAIRVLAPSKMEQRKKWSHMARSVRRTVRNIKGVGIFAAFVWFAKRRQVAG